MGTATVLRATLVVAAALLAAPGAASAATVDLLTEADVRIDGAAGNQRSASAVAGAGDVNGDGRDDVVVGAPSGAGTVYVLYSQATPVNVDLASLSPSQGFQVNGAVSPNSNGTSVAAAGDFNGDGRDDVIMGAELADSNGRSRSGSTYVIFGSAANPGTINLGSLTSDQGIRIDGAAANDHSGKSVEGAGDVNGDDRADVIIGAFLASRNGRSEAGSAYIVYGSASPANLDLNTLTSATGFRVDGAAAGDNNGTAVAGAGDINGDGRDDVITGAPGVDVGSTFGNGSSYVIYGAIARGTLDLAGMTSVDGFRMDGATQTEANGTAVAGAGDVNGDGRDDVITAAPTAPGGGTAYVVLGSANPANVSLGSIPGGAGFRIDAAGAGDFHAETVSAADVNGDGFSDVITGAKGADNNGRSFSGSTYVLYGSGSPGNVSLATLTTEQGLRIDGAVTNDGSGGSVGAGDFDGDGRPDVVTGAQFAGNNGRSQSGSTYVVHSDRLPWLNYVDSVQGTVGTPLVIDPTRNQTTGSASYSISPALPAGLSLDAATGRISGTPGATAGATHRIVVVDANGMTSWPLELSIVPPTPPPAPAPPAAGGSPSPVPTPTPATPVVTRRPAPAKPSGRCTIRLRRGKVNLSCDITYVRGRKSSTRVTITRRGRTYATATGVNRLKLKVRRKMAAGRYTLIVRVRSGSAVVTRRQTVRLRR